MCVPVVFRKNQVRAKKMNKVQSQQYFRMETTQLAV
jgi:hypothetical protein